MLPSALVTVNPGGSVTIPYEAPRLTNGSVTLRDVSLKKTGNRPDGVEVYALTIPGQYTMKFEYQYSGDTAGRTDVFQGSLTSNAITINLVQ